MSNRYFIIDTFTDEMFSGNPAAVVLLTEDRDDQWMLRVAREFNLSETAFVRIDERRAQFRLRWFSPGCEVELCGHATLAAAHAVGKDSVTFNANSGPLVCNRTTDGDITVAFPLDVPEPLALDIARAFPGSAAVGTYRSRFDLLIELADESEIVDLRPNFDEIRKFGYRGVVVTARGSSGSDYVNRCFYPLLKVDEDPVTGSAHCVLGRFWSDKLGKSKLSGKQMSERGGRVQVEVDDDSVRLTGRTITVMSGDLHA